MKIRWMAKNLKNRIVLSAGIVSYMILLFMRIPLSRVIGDAGVGLFAPALELFLLTALVTSYGMSRALAGIMRYRVKRERYRNARVSRHYRYLLPLAVKTEKGYIVFGQPIVLRKLSVKA